MTTTCNTASFRKLTPAILAAQQLAMANDIVETTKAEVSIALKKAAPALGIDGTCYHILDILIGLTGTDDWHTERRPLVAISNEKLAEYVCRSKRTVIRCLKRLVEAGIIAYRDSPTGRRYIHRKEHTNGKYGQIQRGYGFDFSPARQRVEELKGIAEAFTERLNFEKDARRAVTYLTRSLRDMADLAREQGMCFKSIEESLAALEAQAMSPACRAEALQMIEETARTCLQTTFESEEMSCAGDIDVTPYNHTNTQTPEKSNKRGPANADRIELSKPEHVREKIAFEEADKGTSRAKSPGSALVAGPEGVKTGLSAISIGLISCATWNTQDMLGSGFESWADLVEASDQLRLAISLSVDGWKQAVATLGTKKAAAVLVVTVEKTLRDPISIANPAGYFRACVERAKDGKLALHKSLYGLQNA